MPQHPVRKIWEDTCVLWQAHCEKWPDCHLGTVLFSRHLHSILSYYSHSTQCSIKRGFLSNQNNIIMQPEGKHQISRKSRFQFLNEDFLPDTCSALDTNRSPRPTIYRLSCLATERLALHGGWVPRGAQRHCPRGPAVHSLSQSNLRAQIVPTQSQASLYFLWFWSHLPLELLDAILVGITWYPQSSALSTSWIPFLVSWQLPLSWGDFSGTKFGNDPVVEEGHSQLGFFCTRTHGGSGWTLSTDKGGKGVLVSLPPPTTFVCGWGLLLETLVPVFFPEPQLW